VNECKPLPPPSTESGEKSANTSSQGRTLEHFSAKLKRFLWDRGCIKGLFRGYQGVLRGSRGCLGSVLSQK